jgi:hypothetical protein
MVKMPSEWLSRFLVLMLDLTKFTNTAFKIIMRAMKIKDHLILVVSSIWVNVIRIVEETTTLRINLNIGKDMMKVITISQKIHHNLHRIIRPDISMFPITSRVISISSSTTRLASNTMVNLTHTNSSTNNIMVVDNSIISSKTITPSINSTTNQRLSLTSSINSIQLGDSSRSPSTTI